MEAIKLFSPRVLIVSLLICAAVFQGWKWSDETKDEPVDGKVKGTVFSNRDCGCFIRYIDGDLERAFKPVNLDKRFCREGLKIRFQFEYIDTLDVKAPWACPELIPVKVFNVEKENYNPNISFP